MSIIKSVQNWLAEYDGLEFEPLTDITGENPSSYALALTGTSVISVDILGNRTYQHSYHFMAREQADTEADRADTHDFLEALCEWIEQRNDADDLPKLPGEYESIGINVSNAMLMDIFDDGTGLYQVQIQINFKKGRA